MRRPAAESGAEERALARLLGHRFGPLVEALAGEESFVARSMFGCLGCYVHGRLKLVLADRRPPWSGILVATEREHHRALREAVPRLRVHPVLGKWLLLPAFAETFEDDAATLADLARVDDPRLGVEPRPRRLSRRGRRRGRR